jgi:hypothetical protein
MSPAKAFLLLSCASTLIFVLVYAAVIILVRRTERQREKDEERRAAEARAAFEKAWREEADKPRFFVQPELRAPISGGDPVVFYDVVRRHGEAITTFNKKADAESWAEKADALDREARPDKRPPPPPADRYFLRCP